MNTKLVKYALLCSLILSKPLFAEEKNEKEKPAEPKSAIELETNYKIDFLTTVSDSKGKDKAFRKIDTLGLLDFKVNLDGEKAFGINGLSGLLEIQSTLGSKPNKAHVGSAQGIDNIETATNTTKIYQAWLQKSFFDGKLSILGGIYDFNSEFYVTDSAGSFIHPAFALGSDISQSTLSVYPTTAFSVRAKYQPNPNVYVQGVIADGIPGDPNNPKGTHVQFNKGDGAFQALEIGYLADKKENDELGYGKLALGVWQYTVNIDHLVDVDLKTGELVKNKNKGIYVLAEKTLYREPNDPNRGLVGFIHYGVASQGVNPFRNALAMGVTYKGLFKSRPDDVTGIAVAQEHNSDAFKQQTFNDTGYHVGDHETTLELFHSAQINKNLKIQPDLQYVMNHGAVPNTQRKWIGILRVDGKF